MNSESGERAPEPQSVRGAPGSRDTGSDEPGGGPVDRPSGSFDDEETVSGAKSANTAPADPTAAEPAVPPYDGRQKTAKASAFKEAESASGPNTGGAGQPVVDSKPKSPSPDETAGGRTASPADEQPAAESRESDPSDGGVGPAHRTGVGRGEDKKR
ncbi:hypothetical protein [Rhodococcus erythropolis]|uniref:hypothetical protein n=1 Tax=Rhodococcus erythropolis TaxID=1833 RepID=UPI001BE96510|nr:hypothetical protein [Rhodococcus erythropolis]MBT2264311.1 hypothetical protein [Rhodococcus erythropolis]